MGVVILMMLGAGIGWAASLFRHTDRQGVLVDVVAGMLGALLGGWLLRPLFGGGAMSAALPGVGGLLESAIGALVLLAVVHLVRRGMHTD